MEECRFFTNRVLPSVYSDELSYYEQLNKLCKQICDLTNQFNNMVIDYVTVAQLQESQDEQDRKFNQQILDNYNKIMDYTQGEIVRLEKLIAEAIAGKVTIFDPTYGLYPRKVEQVVKNVYHWLRYYADYALTIDALNLTAKTRDDYQIRAKDFDLYSMMYYSHTDNPTPLPTDAYVKKHDIMAYYFDRMGG